MKAWAVIFKLPSAAAAAVRCTPHCVRGAAAIGLLLSQNNSIEQHAQTLYILLLLLPTIRRLVLINKIESFIICGIKFFWVFVPLCLCGKKKLCAFIVKKSFPLHVLWLVVASISNAGKVEIYSSAHKRRDGSGTEA